MVAESARVRYRNLCARHSGGEMDSAAGSWSGGIARHVMVGLMFWWQAGVAATIDQLTRPPTIDRIKISPDGSYLAVRTRVDGERVLQFLERDTLESVGGLSLVGEEEVGDYFWVNDHRVVLEIWRSPREGERPINYGELYAVDADGTHGELVFGYRSGEKQVGSHIPKKDRDLQWAQIIDVLPEDERRVLISTRDWFAGPGSTTHVSTLDTYTGRERGVRVPTGPWGAEFLTDSEGEIRVVDMVVDDRSIGVHTLPRDGDWLEIADSKHGNRFDPVAISEDGKWVHALDDPTGNLLGLYKMSLDGSRYELVYEDDRVDVTRALLSTDGRSVYGLRLDDGVTSYVMLSSTSDDARLFKQLLATFPGNAIYIESRSRDARYWIVRTSSDVDEGVLYLFDQSKGQLRVLARLRPEVDADSLQEMRPIEFASFDGVTVHGYYTPARSRRDGPAPVVVLVHDGPSSRTYWHYDARVQTLATNGFAVLQFNYRGSTGYGSEFESLGDRQWGGNVQKDIIAGTRWAIGEGMAEAGRVCIMGSGFGAYSAVQSAVLEPDLFACVVADGGMYDLALLYRQEPINSFYLDDAYLEEKIGRDSDELERDSPVNHAEVLKAPVLLTYDPRNRAVPRQHAFGLRRALDRHGRTYRWFERPPDEGAAGAANEAAYLEAAVAFLRQHLM